MSDTPEPRKARLLIGAGSFADADSALRLAEALAGLRMAADLGGLLIEAPVGGLTGGKVVSATGQLREAPSPEEAARAAERDARAFRRKLSVVAKAKTVQWSFDRRAGDLATCMIEATREWDIVVMGATPLHRAKGRVVWIAPEDAAGRGDGKAMAEALAGTLGTQLVSFSLQGGAGDERFATLSELLARVNRVTAAAVVADMRAGPLTTPGALRELMQAARCPVLLLGAPGR